MENGQKKSKGWLYLIPLYIIAAIVIIVIIMKSYSTDIKLTDDTLSAFNTNADIKKEESYKFYEPNLADLTYSVNYKNIGQEKDRVVSTRTYILADNNSTTTTATSDLTKQKKGTTKNEADITKDIKQKEMAAVGYKKGFLTDAVAKLANNPKAISALFNNEFVVNGFLSRDSVKRNLSDSKALESYLSNPQVIGNFLNNSFVQQALNNPQLLNSIAQSKMIQEIISSKAVTDIMSDPDKMNKILTNNPGLTEVMANPNVISALSKNQQGSKILMNIGNK